MLSPHKHSFELGYQHHYLRHLDLLIWNIGDYSDLIAYIMQSNLKSPREWTYYFQSCLAKLWYFKKCSLSAVHYYHLSSLSRIDNFLQWKLQFHDRSIANGAILHRLTITGILQTHVAKSWLLLIIEKDRNFQSVFIIQLLRCLTLLSTYNNVEMIIIGALG